MKYQRLICSLFAVLFCFVLAFSAFADGGDGQQQSGAKGKLTLIKGPHFKETYPNDPDPNNPYVSQDIDYERGVWKNTTDGKRPCGDNLIKSMNRLNLLNRMNRINRENKINLKNLLSLNLCGYSINEPSPRDRTKKFIKDPYKNLDMIRYTIPKDPAMEAIDAVVRSGMKIIPAHATIDKRDELGPFKNSPETNSNWPNGMPSKKDVERYFRKRKEEIRKLREIEARDGHLPGVSLDESLKPTHLIPMYNADGSEITPENHPGYWEFQGEAHREQYLEGTLPKGHKRGDHVYKRKH